MSRELKRTCVCVRSKAPTDQGKCVAWPAEQDRKKHLRIRITVRERI